MPEFDVVVIGAGPGGYVAAIRAAQLGFRVAVVERASTLGGTCVRVGCIPSKALLESTERLVAARDHAAEHGIVIEGISVDLAAMHARKERVVKANTDGVAYLFKKHGITRFEGEGRLAAEGVSVATAEGEVSLQAPRIVLATGSRVASLPGVPVDGERIVGSTEALGFATVPEHLVVIGAGVIGVELGSVWRRLGARVTLLEALDRILPGCDAEIGKEARRIFTKQGLEFRTSVRVRSAQVVRDVVQLTLESGEEILADRVLVATGRVPNASGLGLAEAGVQVDGRGRVVIDQHYQTSRPGTYAIGDLIHGPMLAHKAEEDGVALAESFATGHVHAVDATLVPNVVYTDPEIASVGRTEEELVAMGIPYAKGVFPLAANGRARAMGRAEGKIKVLAHQTTDRLLGVHAIGAHAGDLIAEAVAAMAFHASSEDLARVIHAHPTLSEALKEAALAVAGRPLHL
jgi:dihydrolipoamide dehydrogenase